MDEAALSNGSSQSKRPKRNNEKSITYVPPRGDVSVAEATSPVNSQGGVTSSSPDENGDNNRSLKDASQDEPAAPPPPPPTADPESPAVIDAEHHESECPF